MAIIFGHFAGTGVQEVDFAEKNNECLAKGETIRVISAAELDAMSEHETITEGDISGTRTIWPKRLLGRLIELKPGAFTEEQVEKIRSGALAQLGESDYGKKWRIWYGWPTDEQKAATPWEG